ncbi:retrovirus-related pol polyprotein from transposon TNT 1-94 [Tanacetum coccineum]
MLPSNIIYLYVCPGVGSTCADIMADLNIPANDVLVEQAPVVAPPIRTDDQILLNTNFFRAFTASSTILVIYIQQFWDTMCFNSSTGLYSCQVDEQWFNLHKDLLRDALVSLQLMTTILLWHHLLVIQKYLATTSRDKKMETRFLRLIPNVDSPRLFVRIRDGRKYWDAVYLMRFLMMNQRSTLLQRYIKSRSSSVLPLISASAGLVGKRHKAKSPLMLIDEPSDEGVPVEEPAHDDEEADLQRALELILKEQREKRNSWDQDQLLWLPPMPTESSAHAESPSMDAELNLTDNKGQAGPNPGVQDEGQAGPNPGIAAESQLQSSHVVHVEPNLEHMGLGTFDASTQQKPEQIDEEFTTIAYPNVQENLKLPTEDKMILEEPASSTGTLSSLQNLEKDLSFTDQFFVEKPHEEEPGKTNAKAEVQSMVLVPIIKILPRFPQ